MLRRAPRRPDDVPRRHRGVRFNALKFSARHVIAWRVAGRLMCSKLAFFHSFSVSLFFTNVAPVIPWMLFFYTGDFGTAW